MTRLLLADVLPLEDPAAYAFLYGMTSSERKRTADSFRFMKDRMLSVGAAALLDAGLREFGLRERDMTYGRSEHGKPFFLNAPDIHFNISHSASKVAVAFSDREVGCDIEEAFAAALSAQSVEQEAAAFSSGDVKEAFAAGLSAQSVEQEAAKCLEMAGRFFSREEYLAVKAAESPSECIRTFYRCWTLKESYMKATGLGLSLAPDSFSVAALCTGGSGSLLHHSDIPLRHTDIPLRHTGIPLHHSDSLGSLSTRAVGVGDACPLLDIGCFDSLSSRASNDGDGVRVCATDGRDGGVTRCTADGREDCVTACTAAGEGLSDDGFVFYTIDSFEGYECALCCRPEACVPEVMLVRLGER